MSQLAYRRVLLKLSGEALMGSEDYGIDPVVLNRLAREVIEAQHAGAEIALVIGGGNIFRGAGLAAGGMDRVTGDQMGVFDPGERREPVVRRAHQRRVLLASPGADDAIEVDSCLEVDGIHRKKPRAAFGGDAVGHVAGGMAGGEDGFDAGSDDRIAIEEAPAHIRVVVVVAQVRVQSALRRAFLGVPFINQRVTSTTPYTALISTKSAITSMVIVHLDGRLDWMVTQRNALLAWTGHTLSLSPRVNTSMVREMKDESERTNAD